MLFSLLNNNPLVTEKPANDLQRQEVQADDE